jgi:mRNA-degrading endonuclease toxin of MazEF toxin-antitoxin module
MDCRGKLGGTVNRGDIWIVDLGGRIGRRPVVILTRDNVIPFLNKVTVAEITTRGKGYPTEIPIRTAGNLPHDSFVLADSLHTIPKNVLDKHTGTLNEATMSRVSRAVVLALGLEEAAAL